MNHVLSVVVLGVFASEDRDSRGFARFKVDVEAEVEEVLVDVCCLLFESVCQVWIAGGVDEEG